MVGVSLGGSRWVVQRVFESDLDIFLENEGCFADSRAGHRQVRGGAGCVWERIPTVICRNVPDPSCIGEPVHGPEKLAERHRERAEWI
jgi:hypothetical protein